ncbi:MAG: hypothetical protein UU64_C0004G0058 [candidate division WWE3 bacterium GW2011_GWF2_41_45]|uniref:PPM-type phosphatase domain-containing protein n=2 Tax=Katanobacteria TaxID=422282 RepID=A0A1F4W0T8_UNCKA|nr:MAG: hypothetical protein UU55_C0007G0044 [candidate division WWE3 bacterium GW2011_GWC2_41_23]KKS10461.1 MAG: hypothetical protein UU64_C0004G0058 [candidate division WWE3 bacterium GW2011_GWF2_41_45]KKS26069.1 MAG: hypothetical protein UU86_C0043G0004 [candidate division WWE3 bacterium GW2011_GWC1_42_102]KKS29937.1 MAG: hypothetical protein UU90_C0006G0002 [candidate division WWE3 bacterium GW2011_GWD2_42_11]KKS50722.1 MAG: hypothetical protein UV16_C0007G0090 [candidate division WWE3 bact
MKKKLTAKIQEINPTLQQFSTSFSKCLVIEPESKEILLKKGSIYAVYEVTGTANFDTALTDRVLRDILHNSYFQSDNISPIQSLEKAIVEAKEKILQLSNDALSAEPAAVQLNVTAGVLWGNVFYAVGVGDADSYLMREGGVKPIEAVSEGTFTAASGIVKDEDVVILCSRQFSKNYPPQKLLSTRIAEQNLKENEACILLKFIIDTSFTEEEVIDFGLEKQASKNRKREQVEKIILGARKSVEKAAPLAKKFTGLFAKKKQTTSRIDISGVNKKQGIKINKKVVFLLPVLGVILIGALIWQLAGKKSPPKVPEQQVQNETPAEVTQPQEQTINIAEITKDDGQYKVLRVTPEIFYDIKITDQSAEPGEIVSVAEYLIVSDTTSGKIYKSVTDTAKFEAETASYPGIKSLINANGKVGFLQNNKFYSYSPATPSDITSFDMPGVEIINTYSDYLYGITADKLNRYQKDGAQYTETLWGQNAEFQNARSLTVAYSIYLLTSNGTLTKYTSGNKNTFEVKGLNNTLAGATKVITDIDFDNIYILDPPNQRVVVLDDEGVLIKQYTHEPQASWDSLKNITVTSDESTIYLLNGSKVMTLILEAQN